jgi:hypothetical protein
MSGSEQLLPLSLSLARPSVDRFRENAFEVVRYLAAQLCVWNRHGYAFEVTDHFSAIDPVFIASEHVLRREKNEIVFESR